MQVFRPHFGLTERRTKRKLEYDHDENFCCCSLVLLSEMYVCCLSIKLWRDKNFQCYLIDQWSGKLRETLQNFKWVSNHNPSSSRSLHKVLWIFTKKFHFSQLQLKGTYNKALLFEIFLVLFAKKINDFFNKI